jgi:3'-phosphoadenosine 5'-phosphosulfate sulfotransferase (PAPS reductase)/FAD synthetase
MSPELVLCAALDAQRARLPVSEAELASFLRRHGPALTRQLAEALPRPRWSGVEEAEIPAPPDARPDTAALLPLGDYDRILVGFSGGKDSVACALLVKDALIALGIDPAERLELWHHRVDGAPDEPPLLDWPCTEGYCVALAAELGLPLYQSWREGGFLREMGRDGTPTAPVTFETPSGRRTVGGSGPAGTRRLFPQVSGDLSVRWCSAYLKIMVGATAITNAPRFSQDARVLMVTGERRQESAGRARYAQTEEHRASAPSKGRIVHHHRPILGWTEGRVWGLLRRHGVVPHPCYWLGFGRASCETCIFSQASEWATLHSLHPERVAQLSALEAWTGKTIHRARSIPAQVAQGESFAPVGPWGEFWRRQALVRFTAPTRVRPEGWTLPPGAFHKTSGPT